MLKNYLPPALTLFTAAMLCFSTPAISSESLPDPVTLVYEPYAQLLKDFLSEKKLPGDGLISAFDYAGALNDEATDERLVRQREQLAAFDTDSLDSRERAIAFWLNAYNFFMIAHILENRPDGELVGSVWDYGGRINPFRDSVFERELFEIDGRRYSLDGIEKGILLGDEYRERGWFEARVHFAVNCASVGCPPLRRQIYTPDNVDELMTENTRRAFNTPRQLEIDGNTLRLSRLFEWYEADFVEEAGSIREFIRRYADEETAAALQDTTRISYIDYDWSLNKPENFPEFD